MPKRGFPRLEWQKLRERNEALDCRVYARAATWIAGADRWPEAKWRDLESQIGPAPDGIDSVEFLISPNRGEPARPLRQIASGGELSRIMLVLKKVLKERTGVNVLVFDEVDSVVSGAVARAVGEKLKALSAGSQVICITHLPQVASLADAHIFVQKQEVGGRGAARRTIRVVRELSPDERVDEGARMLAGREVTKASRESARELLRTAPGKTRSAV